MFMSDFLEYVEKGDDIVLELYSGKARRGIFVDYDEYAVILMSYDNSLTCRRIIPVEEVETLSVVYTSDITSKIEDKKED